MILIIAKSAFSVNKGGLSALDGGRLVCLRYLPVKEEVKDFPIDKNRIETKAIIIIVLVLSLLPQRSTTAQL